MKILRLHGLLRCQVVGCIKPFVPHAALHVVNEGIDFRVGDIDILVCGILVEQLRQDDFLHLAGIGRTNVLAEHRHPARTR